jgi:hypothetical protein
MVATRASISKQLQGGIPKGVKKQKAKKTKKGKKTPKGL